MVKQPLQVCFMPWANLKEETRIGSVIFWSWEKKKLSESVIADHLDRYFESYVDHHNNPVTSITVCTIDTYNRFDYASEDIKQIQDFSNVLIFSTIAPAVNRAVRANNNTMAPPTSDRYQLTIQKFLPGEDLVAIDSLELFQYDIHAYFLL